MKYPLAYYYQNLAAFPSPSFMFGALSLWFSIFVIFLLHLLQILDEDRFIPFRLSWFSVFLNQLIHNFLIVFICYFFIFELYTFFDLLLTRFFFVGSVGYPKLLSIVYSVFLDIFRLLCSFDFFSSFLKDFVLLRPDVITYTFADFSPYPIRRSFVQPDFLVNSHYYSPNFFVWFCSQFLDLFSSNSAFVIDDRAIMRRELVQDIRKYNYLRNLWSKIELVGQLYSHGYNGRNYRLDFEVFNNLNSAVDQTQHFDWRFKKRGSYFVRYLAQVDDDTKQSFFSNFFNNFEPSYYLYPAVNLTTFSYFPSTRSGSFNNALYPFGLFFFGFDKLSNISAPYKFAEFDYATFYNTNFFSSLYSSYASSTFYSSLASFAPEWKNIGVDKTTNLYGEDFLFPVLPQFRIKEKFLPINFYVAKRDLTASKSFFDPYFVLYGNEYFNPSSYYYLDLKIQNWFIFTNVLWNQNYHFFYKRSFRSDGSGSVFRFSNGSYKFFIGSSTLEEVRLGQYFYNYLPWLQYKHKWLLYPTATYKRFDNYRTSQSDFSKKFYFASLLKFYQVHFYRWQLAAKAYQWRIVQSRNLLVHLLFYKQTELENIYNLRLFFKSKSKKVDFLHNSSSLVCFDNLVNDFSSVFFDTRKKIFDSNSFYLGDLKIVSNKSFYGASKGLFVPSINSNDFKLFQYTLDLRRLSALQPLSVRLWNFDHYLRYLGPLMHRSDVSSLMGFFAPFEYRNQIFVSRLRNDSIRFSVFFPIKNYTNVMGFDNNKDFSSNLDEWMDNSSTLVSNATTDEAEPRIITRQWQVGEGWLKFVVPQTINAVTNRKDVLFNFGLSGIGRLPRLSRAYFQMLFVRNRMQNFVDLKHSFVKLQLMSIPAVSIYSRNKSFNLFWLYFLSSYDSSVSVRYSSIFRFSNFGFNRGLVNFSEGNAKLGYLFHIKNLNENSLNLWGQYSSIKAYDKFLFFNGFSIVEELKSPTRRKPWWLFFSSFFDRPIFKFLRSFRPDSSSSFSKVFPISNFKFTLHWYFYPLAYFSLLASPVVNFSLFTFSTNSLSFLMFLDGKYSLILRSLFFNSSHVKFGYNFVDLDNLHQTSSIFKEKVLYANNLNTVNSLFYSPFKYNRPLVSSSIVNYINSPFLDSFKRSFFDLSVNSKKYNSFLSEDFLNFESNLFNKAKTQDGSGRFTMPKALNSRFDQIFTYREFEKFKREHHRQRFRGVFPYWIQRASRKLPPDYTSSTQRLHYKDLSMEYATLEGDFNKELLPEKFGLLQRYTDNITRTDAMAPNVFNTEYSGFRTHEDVSFFVPYQYAKWYFASPRLSLSVPNKFIDIYVNNQYNELKLIFVHSFLLLKRKIMFDIFSLKLGGHLNDVLYYYPLPSGCKDSFVNGSVSSRSNTVFSRLLGFFSEFFLVFYFFIFDSSGHSFFPSWSSFQYLFSIRTLVNLGFFNSSNYVRLLYNPMVSRFLHSNYSSSIDTTFDSSSVLEKAAAKKVYTDIALSGRFSGHPVNLYNFGYRGEYMRLLGRNFRRYALIDFSAQQDELEDYDSSTRFLDNFFLKIFLRILIKLYCVVI